MLTAVYTKELKMQDIVHHTRQPSQGETSPSLTGRNPSYGHIAGELTLGGQQHTWSVWDGQTVGRDIAIDTETTPIERHLVPQLAMTSISDGVRQYLPKPEQLPAFLLQHLPNDHRLIFHNVAFDFAVIDKYLSDIQASDARDWLCTAVDQDRAHDTMLLAALVSLAHCDDDRLPSLADAVKKWCGYDLEKDVCRLRQFGFLTEAIQGKAAISLDGIYRKGLRVGLQRAAHLRQIVDDEIQEAIKKIHNIDPDLWRRDLKTRVRKTTNTSGLPRQKMKKLLKHFNRIVDARRLVVPVTKTGKLSTSVNKCWSKYRDLDPLVDAYRRYSEQTKLRSFFDGLEVAHIHPKYRTIVRTGRTSCSSPNIQQLPRTSPIREALTARPEHLLFIIDSNSLESRTLATVCHQLFGFSKLRDVLIEGIDPHSYTAAMFAGATLDRFNELPERKQLRQRAKVFNFGLPAGFGATSLVEHAKFIYDIVLTLDDAKRFIGLLTETIDPELGLYLSEDTAADGRRRSLYLPQKTTKLLAETIAAKVDHIVNRTGLAKNTIRRRIGRSEQFFQSAVKHELLDRNPFAGEASAVGGNDERLFLVPAEWIERCIRVAPCEDWRIILAFARYAGMRSHECRIQRWDDIDVVNRRMLIRSNKTPPVRSCPIFPELLPHLLRAKEMAADGAEFVQTRYSHDANLLTTLVKIVTKAGLVAWPKLMQNLRATRETELMANYPTKDVTTWLGNSPAVAQKHYAMVTQASFDRATADGAQLVGITAGVPTGKTPLKVPPTSADMAGNAPLTKTAVSENPVNCWESLQTAVADLPLSCPTRT